MLHSLKNTYQALTLKRRIILIFVFSSTLMFFVISLVSYFAIDAILKNKINAGIESNLRQIQLALLNNLSDLNHVSQQLGEQGVIGINLEQFLRTTEPYERVRLITQMKTDLNIITFTNPGIGFVTYYFNDDHSFFIENSSPRSSFNPDALPLIASYYQLAYHGPHISLDRFNNQYVLSVVRKIRLADRDEIYIYIETGFKLTQSILETDRTGIKSAHLMLDNNGRVAYSEAPEAFPVNSAFPGGGANKHLSGIINDYYWFKAISNQGWSIVSVIPDAEYNRERNEWFRRMAVLLVLFLAFNLMLALLLWNTVYRPLDIFHDEIHAIEGGNYHHETTLTRIPEFDRLLHQFQRMKQQILLLIKEVQLKEQRRADLEIEKLRYQINPHFLMNTLNMAHWLAVMNNQTEIDRVVLSLNKLLAYNLGKTGRNSTIADEIEALRQYLVLQQMRHEFSYEVSIAADDAAMRQPIPRFILQPIVENAIYHGLNTNGCITVTVAMRERVEITIHDTGAGMNREKIEALLHQDHVGQEKVGMGIGLNYVQRMLESHYNGQAVFEIESVPGQGTTVRISLPVYTQQEGL